MRTLRSFVLVAFAALSLLACEKRPVAPVAPASAPAAGPVAAGGKVRVDLYVMSLCPYGVQAENAIGPVLEKLGSAVDFRLNYIAGEQNGKLVSLHREPEVKGDIVQLCAARANPDRFFRMVLCQNKEWRRIPDNWEQCAQEAGIDVEAVRACYQGPEGEALLRASMKLAEQARAEGSPTIHIAGKPYEGGRRTNDFIRAICAEAGGTKPPACTQLKPPATVTVTILNDSRCKPCQQITRIIPQLQGIFPGLKHTMVDYGTPEGKKLFAATGAKYLPAVLFDASLDGDAEGKEQVSRFLRPAGAYRLLAIGAKFDPKAEICDNNVDDNGDGKVDCGDPTCKETLLCRPEAKKHLDVFVMSQCPFGVRALDAAKEVLNHFAGQGVTLSVHYIASATPDGFRSLHGQAEVDENIRGVCAIKHYPAKHKFMDYIWCRNPNIHDGNWKTCAKNGIDAKVMEACATGPEGKKLLADNIKLAETLGVEASPSWLANGKFPFSGIDAETIKTNLCKHNAGLKGCDKTLSGPPAGGPGAGGGGSCGN
jgi:protein-disulfide isomerase